MTFDPQNPKDPIPYSLSMQGLSVDVPAGWEARIQQASPQDDGAQRLPVMHAATVPLVSNRADYGGGVVEALGTSDVFVSLVEFGEEAVGASLYEAVTRLPRVTPSMFHPFQLQRRIPGQAGVQIFFTLEGRAFCQYVVIGSYARRIELSAKANEIIDRMSVATVS